MRHASHVNSLGAAHDQRQREKGFLRLIHGSGSLHIADYKHVTQRLQDSLVADDVRSRFSS